MEDKILIETGRPRTAPRVGLINFGVRQGCPLLPSLFNLYIDDVIQNWQMCLPDHFMIGPSTIDTLLFADDQTILSNSENRLQLGIHLSNGICKDSGLQISTIKTKVMAFCGTDPVQAKIVTDGTVLEQFSNLEYLGCSVSYNTSNDMVNKLHKFNLMRCV